MLESGIVAAQKDDTREIPDYVHNNVLRAAINGTWGESFSSRADTPVTLTHSIPLRDNDQEYWNPANLSVVAFLYNSSSVAQAAKVKVTP